MLKNDSNYNFLLRSKYKGRIRFRRVSISKNLVHFGSLGLLLAISASVLGLGAFAFASRGEIASLSKGTETQAVLAKPAVDADEAPAQPAYDSGGPEYVQPESPEDSKIDEELKDAIAKLDPSFIPRSWAHTGKINNEFGFRRNPFGGRSYEFHPGLDIDGERGESVFAPSSGTVTKAGYSGGYGNMIEIDHGNGITTRYGHLSKIEIEAGDVVTKGQLIGLIGSTGRSTGPHLHYELRLNDRPIDPWHLLPQSENSAATQQ